MSEMGVKKNDSKRFLDLPDSDVACAGCHYCLRGQPRDGRCPECGLAIGDSAARVADRLTSTIASTGVTDERRRSDLRSGPWLILAATVFVLLAAWMPNNRPGSTIRATTLFAAWCLAAVGVAVSTRPVIGASEHRLLAFLRFIARIAALLSIVGLLYAISRAISMQRPVDALWLHAGTLLTVVAPVVATIAYYMYAGLIAAMARNRGTAVSCVLVVVSVLAGYGLMMSAVSAGALGDRMATVQETELASLPLVGMSSLSLAGEGVLFRPQRVGPEIWQVILIGTPWWCALTLVQLALMSGRRVPAVSAESIEASSRP